MFILTKENSIASQFIGELRDVSIQQDRMRFRKNLERLGEILAYEVSKKLAFSTKTIQTPLEEAPVQNLVEQPVLISVLRAAVPFYQGFCNIFDRADSGFVGAYRKEEKSGSDKIEIDFLYQAMPNLTDRDVILVDPMLATGQSFVKTIHNLLKNGNPRNIHIVSVIAAPEGIEYIQKNAGRKVQFWIGAVDKGLNDQFYIVPGLGDAGDLSFGPKI